MAQNALLAQAGRQAVAEEALERRLHVRRRARADGLGEHPASASDAESDVERDIRAAVMASCEALEARAASLVEDLERRLRRAELKGVDPRAAFLSARTELGRIEGRATPEFARLREAARQARADFLAFRAAHGRTADPVYPDSPLLQGALLPAAAAFEASFSATLFASASDGGLLGGAATALGLSGANVALGFLTGFLGLRYLGHRRRWLRVAGGGLCASVCAAAALALNAFAALWREGLEAATPLELAERASLLGLTTPEAVILLMLGAAVWVFSALKGYSGFDDPYPDYGKRHRAERNAAEALAELRAEIDEEMDAPLIEAEAKGQEALSDARAEFAALKAAYDEAADTLLDLEGQRRDCTEGGLRLLRLYWRENQAARRTPAPARAEKPAPFPPPPPDPLARAADLLAGLKQNLAAFETRVVEAGAELGLAREAARQRMEAGA